MDVCKFVTSRGREMGCTFLFSGQVLLRELASNTPPSGPVVVSFSLLLRAQWAYNLFILLTWIQLASTDES